MEVSHQILKIPRRFQSAAKCWNGWAEWCIPYSRILVYLLSKSRFARTVCSPEVSVRAKYLVLLIIILSVYKNMEKFGPHPTTTRSESVIESDP